MDMLTNRDLHEIEDETQDELTIQEATVSNLEDRRESKPYASTGSRVKKVAIPLGIILLGVVAVALMSLFKPPAEKKPEINTTLTVETVPVISLNTTFTVASQGNVAPRTETTLVTEVSGVVVSVSPKLQIGGFFKQGEVLLTLDPSDYQAALKQAEASLLGKKAQLTQELAQSEQAQKEWAITGRSLDEAPILALRQPFLEEAKAGVLFAEAELDRAQRKLDRTKIRIPYDGLIKNKNVDVGQYVTVGSQVLEIFAVDYAEVRLPLSDDDIAFLNLPSPRTAVAGVIRQEDMPSVILTAKIGGKPYEWQANIVRTEGIIDSRSRVHYAVAQINDPYGLRIGVQDKETLLVEKPPLSIGSFVKADIQGITIDNIYALPRDAFRDNNKVMVMDKEGQLRLRDTTVVRADNDLIYVSSGVFNGEDVITTAITVPTEGMAVRKLENE